MPTIDANTGLLLSGVAEVFQSIACIFSTPKGSRIMRRLFGAKHPKFVDRAISPLNLIDFYAEIADAISAEPRFRIAKINLSPESSVTQGHAIFDLEGVYYPKGQLGDFSIAQTVSGAFTWNDPNAAGRA